MFLHFEIDFLTVTPKLPELQMPFPKIGVKVKSRPSHEERLRFDPLLLTSCVWIYMNFIFLFTKANLNCAIQLIKIHLIIWQDWFLYQYCLNCKIDPQQNSQNLLQEWIWHFIEKPQLFHLNFPQITRNFLIPKKYPKLFQFSRHKPFSWKSPWKWKHWWRHSFKVLNFKVSI